MPAVPSELNDESKRVRLPIGRRRSKAALIDAADQLGMTHSNAGRGQSRASGLVTDFRVLVRSELRLAASAGNPGTTYIVRFEVAGPPYTIRGRDDMWSRGVPTGHAELDALVRIVSGDTDAVLRFLQPHRRAAITSIFSRFPRVVVSAVDIQLFVPGPVSSAEASVAIVRGLVDFARVFSKDGPEPFSGAPRSLAEMMAPSKDVGQVRNAAIDQLEFS